METTHAEAGLAQRFRKRVTVGVVLAVSSFGQVALAQTYEIVHAFRNSGQRAEWSTQSSLIQASDGNLYGTSYWGGSAGVGTIFKIDSAGVLTTIHSFAYADGANPVAGLVQAIDGNLYGMTARGGANNLGVIFRMDLSGAVTRLHSIDGSNGEEPRAALVQAGDGKLYGSMSSGGANGVGTIFDIDMSGTISTIHSFDRYVDGANPGAALLPGDGGNFYGTTIAGGETDRGTVFKMDADGDVVTIHTFSALEGRAPSSAVIQDSEGFLYGTTLAGGAKNSGTVFRVRSSGTFATIHSFDPSVDGASPRAGLVLAMDGNLYGVASADWGSGGYLEGTVYRINSVGDFEVLHEFDGSDGASPQTSLLQANDGNFYGTTTTAASCVSNTCHDVEGTAFRMNSSGEVTTLHRFGWTDGDHPQASLTEASDGSLYGTTSGGGTHNLGTIFRREPFGTVTTIHSFDGADGAYPRRLIQASDGDFYGSCTGGGNGNGSFFRLEPSGQITTLHVFDGVVNGFPSDLIQASDGKFYGTTIGGGDWGWGTAFRLDSSGNFDQLRSFGDVIDDGAFPSSLIQGPDGGVFYGTTASGGDNGGVGTVFAMDSSGGVTRLHTFQGPDGYYPTAPPVYAGDLFGTTSEGGDQGHGTVYRLSWYDGLQTIYTFTEAEPGGHLLAADGLYGTTAYYSAYDKGTIFKIDGQGYATVHNFNGIDGFSPSSALIRAADGLIYGIAPGGPFGNSVIFRLSGTSAAVNEIAPTSGSASGGQALDVLGGGFLEAATVNVGGVAAADVVVLDPVFVYLFAPALSPGTLNDVSVINPGDNPMTATLSNAYFADFLDVPQIDPFHEFVEKIFRKGVTAGCGGGTYCPDDAVTRAQMAVFLLKSEHGSAYLPPLCTGVFDDVPCPSVFADWIEQLAAEGITAGCGGRNYCPARAVTRAQMAVFLLKAEHGPAFVPPACSSVFADVPCPSLFASWIEQLAAEQITGGCGGGSYCPDHPNTRGQMSAFLVKTFHM